MRERESENKKERERESERVIRGGHWLRVEKGQEAQLTRPQEHVVELQRDVYLTVLPETFWSGNFLGSF